MHQTSFDSRFGSVGDQEGRPTCVSFAVTGAHQRLLKTPELSVESAIHAAKLAGCSSVSEATTVEHALNGLRSHGQCAEDVWPYGKPAFPAVPGGYGQAVRFKRSKFAHLGPFTADSILARLEGDPLILTMRVVNEAWVAAARSGEITITQGEIGGLHAVLGLEPSTLNDGTRGALIRNSWGRDWGSSGYAIVGPDYLKSHLLRAHVLR